MAAVEGRFLLLLVRLKLDGCLFSSSELEIVPNEKDLDVDGTKQR